MRVQPPRDAWLFWRRYGEPRSRLGQFDVTARVTVVDGVCVIILVVRVVLSSVVPGVVLDRVRLVPVITWLWLFLVVIVVMPEVLPEIGLVCVRVLVLLGSELVFPVLFTGNWPAIGASPIGF